MTERRVVMDGSPEFVELSSTGWRVIARSWGAGLKVDESSWSGLEALVARSRSFVDLRELTAADVDSVLELDTATLADYPGDIATMHAALTREQASPSPDRRGWGAFARDGQLVAVTFACPEDDAAETEFTVVHRDWRGRGISTALKAGAVLALAAEGYRRFRTGGSSENAAIIAANRAVGYVLDEEWITFQAPTPR